MNSMQFLRSKRSSLCFGSVIVVLGKTGLLSYLFPGWKNMCSLPQTLERNRPEMSIRMNLSTTLATRVGSFSERHPNTPSSFNLLWIFFFLFSHSSLSWKQFYLLLLFFSPLRWCILTNDLKPEAPPHSVVSRVRMFASGKWRATGVGGCVSLHVRGKENRQTANYVERKKCKPSVTSARNQLPVDSTEAGGVRWTSADIHRSSWSRGRASPDQWQAEVLL